jgi:hypothetical protein
MTPRQTRRARRCALAVIRWRRHSVRYELRGVPSRLLVNAPWVERHLLDPRSRLRRRQVEQLRTGPVPVARHVELPPDPNPAHVVDLIEVGSSNLIGYRARCVWGHHYVGPVHIIGTEPDPRGAAHAEARAHDFAQHSEAVA